jgi:Co/Zn/Cd efflux system component
LTLYAQDRGLRWRAGAALVKGTIILAFGFGILFEVGRRLLVGGLPAAETIGIVGLVALTANPVCLGLLSRFRTHDVNMSSTFECSRNDVIANVGVLLAAGGVWLSGAAWPDLIVGVLVAAVFLRSAGSIVRAAWPQFHDSEPARSDDEGPLVSCSDLERPASAPETVEDRCGGDQEPSLGC